MLRRLIFNIFGPLLCDLNCHDWRTAFYDAGGLGLPPWRRRICARCGAIRAGYED